MRTIRGRKRDRKRRPNIRMVLIRLKDDHTDFGYSYPIDGDDGNGEETAKREARRMCSEGYEAVIVKVPVPRTGWIDYNAE